MKNPLIFTIVVSVVFTAAWVAWAPSLAGTGPNAAPEAEPRLLAALNEEEPADERDAPDEESAPNRSDQSATDPTDVLRDAREKLIGYKSIKARVLEAVSIGGRKFKLMGTYLQGQNFKLRLEFQVEVGQTKGSLLEVCNGQILWTSQKIGPEIVVTRRDVTQILNAAYQSRNVPQNLLVAELGLGGLPGLLASLERTMQFDSATQETIDGQPFTVIEGTWSSEFRNSWSLVGVASGDPLPHYVPDRVRIYFDKENHFPRRILYLKQIEGREVHRPMVTLDFANIVLDGPVDQRDFDYKVPDGVVDVDITKQYLDRLIPAQPEPQSPADAPVK